MVTTNNNPNGESVSNVGNSDLLLFSLKKKLADIARLSPFRKLGKWVKEITNHVYWSVKATDPLTERRRQLWLTIYNHIQNVHEHPEYPLVPRCAHGDLPERFVDPETGKTLIRYYILQGESTSIIHKVTKRCHFRFTSHIRTILQLYHRDLLNSLS